MDAPLADAETALRAAMAEALGLNGDPALRISGEATLDSAYPVSDLATASVVSAAHATADVLDSVGLPAGEIVVDRPLVDAWFGVALTPVGWSAPSPWDPIAGDYPTADGGWIRLHTNAPHHRAAALRVLGVEGERDRVAAAVARWDGAQLEDAVVAESGCAAVMRMPDAWARHAQGEAVALEPLIAIDDSDADAAPRRWTPSADRPLAGVRVLDLTRVLAGPVATRVLAGLGADVLRIDPPSWDEPGVVPDMLVGKRTARLDARDPAGRATLVALLADADVLVHGYRAGALESIGLGVAERRSIRPGLVEVSLTAYGWTGPWAQRRGFDSLVQMSSGIAGWGLHRGVADRPTPLPVQALDHATGYLMAAAALAGIARRARTGRGSAARLSLARTAAALEDAARLPSRPLAAPVPFTDSTTEPVTASVSPAAQIDTAWGPATLLPAPFALGAVRPVWTRGSRPLGADAPTW